MERVTFSEVDSNAEICNILNKVIDNQNQIEGKLLQLIAEKKPAKKKTAEKGGKDV